MNRRAIETRWLFLVGNASFSEQIFQLLLCNYNLCHIPASSTPDGTTLQTPTRPWPAYCNSWWSSLHPLSEELWDTSETFPLAPESFCTSVGPRLSCQRWAVGPTPQADRCDASGRSFESYQCHGRNTRGFARIFLGSCLSSYREITWRESPNKITDHKNCNFTSSSQFSYKTGMNVLLWLSQLSFCIFIS